MRTPGRGVIGDRGSGSVLALSLVLVIVVTSLAIVAFGAALAGRQRVLAAADAAALAAADAARGLVPGSPCPTAERVAAANGADLVACEVDGVVVTVEAVADVAAIPFRARSRAGPPPDVGVSE